MMDDQILFLLHEYDSLRSELINRTGFGFTLGTIGLGALAIVLSQTGWRLWIGLPIGILIYGSAIILNVRGIQKNHARIVRIETEVNSRSGAHLLEWETRWGAGWGIPPEKD